MILKFGQTTSKNRSSTRTQGGTGRCSSGKRTFKPSVFWTMQPRNEVRFVYLGEGPNSWVVWDPVYGLLDASLLPGVHFPVGLCETD